MVFAQHCIIPITLSVIMMMLQLQLLLLLVHALVKCIDQPFRGSIIHCCNKVIWHGYVDVIFIVVSGGGRVVQGCFVFCLGPVDVAITVFVAVQKVTTLSKWTRPAPCTSIQSVPECIHHHKC